MSCVLGPAAGEPCCPLLCCNWCAPPLPAPQHRDPPHSTPATKHCMLTLHVLLTWSCHAALHSHMHVTVTQAYQHKTNKSHRPAHMVYAVWLRHVPSGPCSGPKNHSNLGAQASKHIKTTICWAFATARQQIQGVISLVHKV